MRKLRILLVDDDELLRLIVGIQLMEEGHWVIPATNGQEAWDLLMAIHPPMDLVITDLSMPVMSGIELIERIRQMAIEIEILAISGARRAIPSSMNLDTARLMGVTGLAKPFDSLELTLAIQSVIRD